MNFNSHEDYLRARKEEETKRRLKLNVDIEGVESYVEAEVTNTITPHIHKILAEKEKKARMKQPKSINDLIGVCHNDTNHTMSRKGLFIIE